ncbi:MAG: SMC family ATPase [Candidatus Heimdallarchaeota archaeon]|nr:SMC family ATPase [Candidatus Heimdallarchaeota archaeon]
MKTFEILNIELENIKTYKYEKIDFSQGNNVLIGENGAGKSTILESVYLSLFGDTVPGKTLADIVRFGERQGKIILRFIVDENEYRIIDEITKKDETQATQKQILINESLEETIAEGKNAVSEKIEEILDIDATTFISAVYASQGEIGKIVTAKDTDRKKLFDRLFQIERFEKTWSNLAKIEKLINFEIKTLQNQIDIMKKGLQDKPKVTKELEERNEELKHEKNLLNKMYGTYKELDKKFKTIEKFVEKYNQLKGQKGIIEKSITELRNQIDVHYRTLIIDETEMDFVCNLTSIEMLNDKIEEILEKNTEQVDNLQEKATKLRINIEKISSLIQTYENRQEINEANKKNQKEEIEYIRKRIPNLKEKIDAWEEEIPKLEEKYKTTLIKLGKEKKELDKIKEKISSLEVKLTTLEESADKYHARIVKKRLNLSQDAGDNWQEVIKEFSTINFDGDLTNLAKMLEENEEKQKEEMSKKSTIDEGIRRIQNNLEHLEDLNGHETCPTCKQLLSKDTLEKLIMTLNQEKTHLINEKKITTQKIKDLNALVDELKNKEKSLLSKKKLYDKIEPIFNELLDLEKEKISVDEDYNKLNTQKIELKEKMPEDGNCRLEEEISINETLLRELKDAKEKLPKFIQRQEKIQEELRNIQSLQKEIQNMKSKNDENILTELNKNIAKLKEELTILTKKQIITKELIKELKLLESEEEKFDENNKALSEIEIQEGFKEQKKIQEEREIAGKTISAKETAIKSLVEDIIPPLIEQKNSLLQKENEVKEKEKSLQLENKKREITSVLRGLMRELPNRLLPTFIERINSTATEILQSIIPSSDIQSIVLNDDYSLNIIRLGNIENISVLSGGETIIIALALRLAFAKEFSTLDSLILDEPTIFLDERRRGELVTVLERNRLVRQMFVVTHDPDFERISDKTYFITKIAGETEVKPIGDDKENAIEEDLNLL